MFQVIPAWRVGFVVPARRSGEVDAQARGVLRAADDDVDALVRCLRFSDANSISLEREVPIPHAAEAPHHGEGAP